MLHLSYYWFILRVLVFLYSFVYFFCLLLPTVVNSIMFVEVNIVGGGELGYNFQKLHGRRRAKNRQFEGDSLNGRESNLSALNVSIVFLSILLERYTTRKNDFRSYMKKCFLEKGNYSKHAFSMFFVNLLIFISSLHVIRFPYIRKQTADIEKRHNKIYLKPALGFTFQMLEIGQLLLKKGNRFWDCYYTCPFSTLFGSLWVRELIGL